MAKETYYTLPRDCELLHGALVAYIQTTDHPLFRLVAQRTLRDLLRNKGITGYNSEWCRITLHQALRMNAQRLVRLLEAEIANGEYECSV